MVGELHLGLGPRRGLEGRGHLGERGGLAGPVLRLAQAPLGGLELAAGGAAARRDVAAAAERVRRVGGQVTGHLGQLVVPGPAEAHRPGQRRGGRPGQVPEEVEPRLLGGVLVVERLDGVPAPLGLRAQPRGLLPQRIGAVAVVDLDVQQGQAGPAGRDPDRRRIHAGRQAADHHRLPPGATLAVPLRWTRAPSLKTVTAVIGASSTGARHRSGSPSPLCAAQGPGDLRRGGQRVVPPMAGQVVHQLADMAPDELQPRPGLVGSGGEEAEASSCSARRRWIAPICGVSWCRSGALSARLPAIGR